MKIAIILAEFGKAPDTSNIRKYFPNSDVSVYGKVDCPDIFVPNPRWGFRMNDYYKVQKLLESDADIAISFDADMHIVSNYVEVLPRLAERFGLCMPANPRKLVRVDTLIGADGDRVLDETYGTGYAMNCSPIALNLHNKYAVDCAEQFCRIMESNPVRGPLAWWRAAWSTGYNPYLLPPQWCVCREDIGIGNEIILHIGHDEVKRHYQIAG